MKSAKKTTSKKVKAAEPEEQPAKFSEEVVVRKVDRVMTVVANVTSAEYGCGPDMKKAVLASLVKKLKGMIAGMEG